MAGREEVVRLGEIFGWVGIYSTKPRPRAREWVGGGARARVRVRACGRACVRAHACERERVRALAGACVAGIYSFSRNRSIHFGNVSYLILPFWHR